MSFDVKGEEEDDFYDCRAHVAKRERSEEHPWNFDFAVRENSETINYELKSSRNWLGRFILFLQNALVRSLLNGAINCSLEAFSLLINLYLPWELNVHALCHPVMEFIKFFKVSSKLKKRAKADSQEKMELWKFWYEADEREQRKGQRTITKCERVQHRFVAFA